MRRIFWDFFSKLLYSTLFPIPPLRFHCVGHKVRIYKEYHSVMSPRRNWDSPNPSLATRVCPSPRVRLRVRGWGSPNSDDWRKKLSTLPALWCQRMLGSKPGLLRLWHWLSHALTTQLYLQHNSTKSHPPRLDLIHLMVFIIRRYWPLQRIVSHSEDCRFGIYRMWMLKLISHVIFFVILSSSWNARNRYCRLYSGLQACALCLHCLSYAGALF